jgi:hypothetical protein
VTCPEAQNLRFTLFQCQVRGDFAELFEGGFKVFDNFLGENVGLWEVIGLFEAFVKEPEDVEAGLSAVEFLIHL